MTQSFNISDELYNRLKADAEARGQTIEQMLESRSTNGADQLSRAEVVSRIDQLRDRLFAKYGEMADSTALIRADRVR